MMKTTIKLLAVFVIVTATNVSADEFHGATNVKVIYTQNGDEVARMVYAGPDSGPEPDQADYWKLLSKAPGGHYGVTFKPDQTDGNTATLTGDIEVSIEIRNHLNMGCAKTEKLKLIRDNADHPGWYLPANELKRVTSLVVSATKTAVANSIYVKVFLPLKPLANDRRPVESWVLDQLKRQKVEHARAVTGWVKLPAYEDIDSVHIWNATTDGKGWGCPVHGSLAKLRPDGKVNVELNGWLPFQPTITGNLILAETGNRRLAIVNGATRRAFFAILVGPPVP